MNKQRSYFVFLETLEKPGCPICQFVLDDSRGYLDSLMYERVLDVPTRLGVMDSFGLCNWHTWQTPSLPPVCAPAVGFSIFASDLLRKFDLIAQATRDKRRRIWKIPFRGATKRLSSLMKGKACPVCVHVARGESYYLRELADFIEEEQFLSAYKRSAGICLPHFFSLEQRLCDHENFPVLERLMLEKVQSLKGTLDAFMRKQDHRFGAEITSSEASAWRTAMELLVGKPGVFNNEIRRDAVQNFGTRLSSSVDLTKSRYGSEQFTIEELTVAMKSSKEITLYLKQPLTLKLFETVREIASCESPPRLEVVVEDFQDIAQLRTLRSSGLSLFYGLGLPRQTVVFLGRNRGYLLENHQPSAKQKWTALKNAEDLYLRLLWCRFGIAVLMLGCVKEKGEKSGLFGLTVDGGGEQWCRFRDAVGNKVPEVGAEVELFGWDKWNTHVVEVLDLKETRGKP